LQQPGIPSEPSDKQNTLQSVSYLCILVYCTFVFLGIVSPYLCAVSLDWKFQTVSRLVSVLSFLMKVVLLIWFFLTVFGNFCTLVFDDAKEMVSCVLC